MMIIHIVWNWWAGLVLHLSVLFDSFQGQFKHEKQGKMQSSVFFGLQT